MAIGIVFCILVVVIAAGIGISYLPQPYYAIGQVVIYAGLLALIAVKLRTCLGLAKGSEYHSMVRLVVIWLVVGVFSVVAHLENLFRTENRDYITLATNVAVYLALLYALVLVELLLKRATAGTGPSAPASNGGATTTRNRLMSHPT
jgi:hypothetical protein